ncbi:MAG: DUF1311 domain-containing protein [Colwellia sp.]|nr:DUF1311 domain-containing protein [Colwellia sp.]
MIKKSLILSPLFLALSFVLPQAYAAKTIKNCENKKVNNIAFSQCLDSVRDVVDRELQTWINNQVFLLEEVELNTGRSSALVMFKRSQSNFITFRENNCRWQYLALSPGTGAGPAYKRCYINTTNSRIKELSLLNKVN